MAPHPPEAVRRLKTLARALTEQTRAGRLKWKGRAPSHIVNPLSNLEQFSVSLPRSTITVSSQPSITVTDGEGEILQEYAPSFVAVDPVGEHGLDAALKDLVREIRNERQKALTALDDIIADVNGLGSS